VYLLCVRAPAVASLGAFLLAAAPPGTVAAGTACQVGGTGRPGRRGAGTGAPADPTAARVGLPSVGHHPQGPGRRADLREWSSQPDALCWGDAWDHRHHRSCGHEGSLAYTQPMWKENNDALNVLQYRIVQ